MSSTSYLGSSCGPILSFFSGLMGLARTSLLSSSSVVPFFLSSTFGSAGGWAEAEVVLTVFYVGVLMGVRGVLLSGGMATDVF
jgi:hypothetical protein